MKLVTYISTVFAALFLGVCNSLAAYPTNVADAVYSYLKELVENSQCDLFDYILGYEDRWRWEPGMIPPQQFMQVLDEDRLGGESCRFYIYAWACSSNRQHCINGAVYTFSLDDAADVDWVLTRQQLEQIEKITNHKIIHNDDDDNDESDQ